MGALEFEARFEQNQQQCWRQPTRNARTQYASHLNLWQWMLLWSRRHRCEMKECRQGGMWQHWSSNKDKHGLLPF